MNLKYTRRIVYTLLIKPHRCWFCLIPKIIPEDAQVLKSFPDPRNKHNWPSWWWKQHQKLGVLLVCPFWEWNCLQCHLLWWIYEIKKNMLKEYLKKFNCNSILILFLLSTVNLRCAAFEPHHWWQQALLEVCAANSRMLRTVWLWFVFLGFEEGKWMVAIESN